MAVIHDLRNALQSRTEELAWDKRRLRAIYLGDKQTTLGAFKDRFMGFSGSQGSNAGYDESDRNILVENELKPLIDQRIEALPATFEIESEDDDAGVEIDGESIHELAEAWAKGRATPDGLDLYAVYEQVKRSQEIDGEAVLVLGKTNDVPWVEVRDAVTLDRLSDDPSNPARVTGWRIGWTRIKEGREVPCVETITETTWTLLEGAEVIKDEAHGLGFIPVVVIPRTMELGGAMSMPGPGELVEAYLNFLWANYLRNIANKYTAFRVWCPNDDITAAALAGDGAVGGVSSHSVYPGAILKANLVPRGGDVDLSSIENQRADSLRTLREIGRGESDPQSRTDMRSGKASVIQSQGLMRYAATKALLIRLGLGQLFTIWARLAGHIGPDEESGICVLLHDQDKADPAEARMTGEMWIKAYAAGLVTEERVLKEFQRLALLDEDTDIDAMIAELQEKAEASQAASMERMAAVLEKNKARPGEPAQPSQQQDMPMMDQEADDGES